MRDLDPEPIRRRLDLWAHGHDIDIDRQHALERWRERLMAEPDAVEALASEFPHADRADCVRSSRVRRTNAAAARRHAPSASSFAR